MKKDRLMELAGLQEQRDPFKAKGKEDDKHIPILKQIAKEIQTRLTTEWD